MSFHVLSKMQERFNSSPNQIKMKKPILLLILAIGCTFISCKQDDSGGDGDLLGTWFLTTYVDNEGEEPADECESKNIVRFKDGNVFDYQYHTTDNASGDCIEGIHDSGTWSYLFDRKVQLDYGTEERSDITVAKYKISGDILTLTFDAGNGEYHEKYKKE
nr:hypothetical protein [Zobellia laminariae]